MASIQSGLGNQALLDKIDKLRELNINSIDLPQLVAVGDQSSGKSSVLESLTGFSFPTAPGLCTRYTTQISCRRRSKRTVIVSIIPAQGTDEAVQTRLKAFRRCISGLTNEVLVKIIDEANSTMGIRMTADDTKSGLQTFSPHTLKIVINVPDQEHFTVIDVPGIFRVPSPPFTTYSDVVLVRDMVKRYLRNSRTIILAVLPSIVDISTQEVLKMAETADPNGTRTLGVLTKPDLIKEKAIREVVKELVLGRRNQLRLGYCVVKNRGADDFGSQLADRLAQENSFFDEPGWESIKALRRCGIESLKTRLSKLLLDVSEKELPKVKRDILQQLDIYQAELASMGLPRTDPSSQRMYLGKMASRFQSVTQYALNGYYNGDIIFTDMPGLKIGTTITRMNKKFADTVWQRGHKRQFSLNGIDDGETENAFNCDNDEGLDSTISDILRAHPELHDMAKYAYQCPKAKALTSDGIMDHIKHVYQTNRGPELGTFSGTILAVVFREQSEKWEPLVLRHVSISILLVHAYIYALLSNLCSDKRALELLWENILVDKLRKTYSKALEHAQFLLRIERDGRPCTFNHYFNSEVQKKRNARFMSVAKSRTSKPNLSEVITITSLGHLVQNKDNAQQVKEDVHDILASYYKVARKRIVDNVCAQAIGHFLLDGEESPMKIFSSELVMGMDSDQLEKIAGEDAETKSQRASLESSIKNLEAALKVLRD